LRMPGSGGDSIDVHTMGSKPQRVLAFEVLRV
jgi:hypothetical protein